MKTIIKYILVFLVLLLPLHLKAQEFFYPLTPGTKLSYRIDDQNNELFGSYISHTKSVDLVDGNGEVVIIYNFFNENNEPVFDDNNNEFSMLVETNNGKKEAILDDLFKARESQKYMSKGDAASVPADLSIPNTTIPDNYIGVKVGGIRTKMRVIDRTFVGMEQITTPAGTFNAYKLTETQTSKVLGFTSKNYITNWLVLGIGCVRQEIYDKNNKLIRVHTLTQVHIPNN